MLGFELKQREAKLAREQAARLEAARRKAAEEQSREDKIKKQQSDLAEALRRRRIEAAEAEEALRDAHLAEVEANNGVLWSEELVAIPRDEEAAGARGIARRADKLCLPALAQSALLAQDAPKNGPMFFELTTPAGRRTHAGVLEFSAPPGTVALPPHTAACLGGDDIAAAAESQEAPAAYFGPLRVRYTRLPKGTFAALQPLWAAFQRDVDDIKVALERTLATHSTLTVGDVVHVTHGGARHALVVRELQPADAVSVIETDLEVFIEVSAEAAAAQAARRKAEEAAAAAAAAAAHAAAHAAEQAAAAAAAASAAATARLQAAQAALSATPEPPEGSTDMLRVSLRLPDGQRATRRFLSASPASLLFDWADSTPGVLHAAAAHAPHGGGYCLAAAFPRRVLRRDAPGTLAQAGLAAGSQEVLNVELLAEDS